MRERRRDATPFGNLEGMTSEAGAGFRRERGRACNFLAFGTHEVPRNFHSGYESSAAARRRPGDSRPKIVLIPLKRPPPTPGGV